jgi:hypothetical protein
MGRRIVSVALLGFGFLLAACEEDVLVGERRFDAGALDAEAEPDADRPSDADGRGELDADLVVDADGAP